MRTVPEVETPDHDELENALAARDEVLAIVAHDLRNPLGAIRMSLSFLRSRMEDDDDRLRKHLEILERSASRMARLIDDLLEASRIEEGKLALDLKPCNARLLAETAIEDLRPLAIDKKQTLENRVGAICAVAVRCDRDRIFQVFSNLIGNAIKFTPGGGRIVVFGNRENDNVVFSISDTGPGISPADQPFVFDRFWRKPGPGRRGIGLGLFIARGIVEAHGGRIWLDSEAGAGTTFHFSLPIPHDAPATR